jgi:hypothetical protein
LKAAAEVEAVAGCKKRLLAVNRWTKEDLSTTPKSLNAERQKNTARL